MIFVFTNDRKPTHFHHTLSFVYTGIINLRILPNRSSFFIRPKLKVALNMISSLVFALNIWYIIGINGGLFSSECEYDEYDSCIVDYCCGGLVEVRGYYGTCWCCNPDRSGSPCYGWSSAHLIHSVNDKYDGNIYSYHTYSNFEAMIVENVIISMLVALCIVSMFYFCCLKQRLSNKSRQVNVNVAKGYDKVSRDDEEDCGDSEAINQDEVEILRNQV